MSRLLKSRDYLMKCLGFVLLFGFISFGAIGGCNNDDGDQMAEAPPEPNLEVFQNIVAIGDSTIAGMQSNGMLQDFSENNFTSHFIRQLQLAFPEEIEALKVLQVFEVLNVACDCTYVQPLFAPPGVSFTPTDAPLTFENGHIVSNPLEVDPMSLLLNADLPRPYNNLAIPAANLFDLSNTVSSPFNILFELILRNLGTQVEQAIQLNPSLLIIAAGSNDLLLPLIIFNDINLITPVNVFEAEYRNLIAELTENINCATVVFNIANYVDLPFFNFFDSTFRSIPGLGIDTPVPVVFDHGFNPLDTDGGQFVPLLTDETDVVHLTVGALSEIQTGVGIPDQIALIGLGFSMEDAASIVTAMEMAGLTPTGTSLNGALTVTSTEDNALQDALIGYNKAISDIAIEFELILVDSNSATSILNNEGIGGYTGDFVLIDVLNTAYSLDGLHLNNGGHALVANQLIEAINDAFGLDIPLLDTSEFMGQFAGSTALTETHDVACDCTLISGACECDVNTEIKLHELQGKNVKMECTNQSGGGQDFISADVDDNFLEFCPDWESFDAKECEDANQKNCQVYCFNPDISSNHSVEVKTIICVSSS